MGLFARSAFRSIAKITARILGYGSLGGVVALVAVFVLLMERRPDLKIWHTADLDAEFTTDAPVHSFKDYLTLEDRLFDQLEKRVYERLRPEDRHRLNRFSKNSLSDPKRWSTNWNRTFELPSDRPTAGVLLVHGMSDSPYSLRTIGLKLHAEGAWVVGLRLPGHGTAPAGLVRATWEDMAASVLLAVRRLYEKIGERPLVIIGYSTGGALGVHYALTTLKDPHLPKIDRLVLVSPSIGVTPVAVLASWQARLGRLLGADKLAWNSILPEYDPFKYGSFAVNAGAQVYRLTTRIQSQLAALAPGAALNRFPSMLAFQSVVDATVSTRAVVDGLFLKLPQGNHELVLFDINRHTGIEQMMTSDPLMQISDLVDATILPFRYSFVTNESRQSQSVVVHRKEAQSNNIVEEPLGLKWPERLYSLSHIALPFPVDDSLYGLHAGGNESDLHLGKMALRGERGLLQIPDSDMLRLRSNPFYDYLERRVLEFLRKE